MSEYESWCDLRGLHMLPRTGTDEDILNRFKVQLTVETLDGGAQAFVSSHLDSMCEPHRSVNRGPEIIHAALPRRIRTSEFRFFRIAPSVATSFPYLLVM